MAPYAVTPGIDSMSAHQRPSSSRPTMIGMDSTAIVSITLTIHRALTRRAASLAHQGSLTVRPNLAFIPFSGDFSAGSCFCRCRCKKSATAKEKNSLRVSPIQRADSSARRNTPPSIEIEMFMLLTQTGPYLRLIGPVRLP